MDARKVFAGTLIAAGVVGLGAIGMYAGRRHGLFGAGVGRSFGRGDPDKNLVTQDFERPPVVGRVKIDGRTVTHYRANDIPIGQRVKLIQDRVYGSVQDPRIRELAIKLIKGCRSRDNLCEAKAIYEAVFKNVRYIGDVAPVKFPDGSVEPIDFFQHAWRTWTMGAGDCDDHVALVASLWSVVGIPTRLRVTAPTKSSDWGHIYPVAGFPVIAPRKWIAGDTTLEPPTRFGAEARYAKNLDYKPGTPGNFKPFVRDLPA